MQMIWRVFMSIQRYLRERPRSNDIMRLRIMAPNIALLITTVIAFNVLVD